MTGASFHVSEGRDLLAAFTAVENTNPGVDGTPTWAYDDDGYCVCCGNGRWKPHMPGCELRDALDAATLNDERPQPGDR